VGAESGAAPPLDQVHYSTTPHLLSHPLEIDSAPLSRTVMSDDDPTPSPASKAFAARLAKYAYNPASSSSSRSGSTAARASPAVRAVTRPTPHLPASPGASSSRSVPAAKRTPPSRRAKRPIPVDVDDDDDEEFEPASDEELSHRKTFKVKGQGKKPRPFAAPEVYAHLKPLPDLLGQDLDIVFCGINPGLCSHGSAPVG
jgi:TDG/mug DNA glycosylase family protein